MLIGIKSMSIQGVSGYFVDVQVDVSNGMPSWEVVGLPDATVRESKERVMEFLKSVLGESESIDEAVELIEIKEEEVQTNE